VSYLFGTTENLQDGDRLGWFWTIMQVIVAVSVAPDRREMQIEARMMVEAEISCCVEIERWREAKDSVGHTGGWCRWTPERSGRATCDPSLC